MPGVLREKSHFIHSMDIAIVTGAETPLGLRLIEDLIRQGCRVHGIGNNFSNVTFADSHFVAHAIDLSDLEAVARTTEEILEKEKALHILIHAIDVTPGAPFEKLPVGNLEAILKVGLLGPIMLTRLALPNLLRFRGQLINIIPANKSGHVASAVNALIEGGLREMNTALFDQARDAGLSVTNLILRQNTAADDTAEAEKQIQTRIDPEHVARTVERLLDPNEPNVPNEITLYPRLSATAESALPETALPIDPYSTVVLPPKEYFPPKQEAIPTREPDQIERTIPYTDEEMEEKIASAIEDYEAHPERYEEPQKRKKKRRERESKPERSEPRTQPDDSESAASKQHDDESSEQSDQTKRRRGRRRGGRNRNRNQQDENGPNERSDSSPEEPRQSRSHKKERREDGARRGQKRGEPTQGNLVAEKDPLSRKGDKNPGSEPQSETKPEKASRPGRNRSRKAVAHPDKKYADYDQQSAAIPERAKATPDQPKSDTFLPGEVKIEPKKAPSTAVAKAKKAPAAKPKQLELVPETKPMKKKAVKKAAKKATKKAATKKAPVKKVPAKKAAKKVAAKKAVKKSAAKKAVKRTKTAE